MTNKEKIKILLLDIMEQSTRHQRACNFKRYLITDLEIIEEKNTSLRKLLKIELGL
jgi:hypothetical protein